MATTTAARSPSPGPAARPGCAVRRSTDSSPAAAFRPASPSQSDSLLRSSSSVCRNAASPRAWCAEKENSDHRDAAGRTPKPARSAGGAKNFMAPTISAASKAVAPSASPCRKKVLGERNEQQQPVPPSPAELAHKPTGGAPPASEAGAPRRLRLSFDGAPAAAAAAPPAAATSLASQVARHSLGGEERTVETFPCNKHHHAAAVDSASPQAAGPYDPKTNYLSPRPRFLHYKPNPRVELYRHGVRRLEDGFASESSDETGTTNTTEQDEEELMEVEQEKAQPLCELGDDAAVPAADALALPLEPALGSPPVRLRTSEPAKSSPRARVQKSEPGAISPQARVLTPEAEPPASSAQARDKKRSSLRLLVAPLALVLFMAAAFCCVPPPPDSPVMPQTALWKVSDFLSVQEFHPVELAAWLKQWSSSSLNLVTSYWEALVSTREPEFFGPHFAANLSAAGASADEGVGLYSNFAETRPILMEDISVSVLEQNLTQNVVSASGSGLITEIGDEAIAWDQESIHSADIDQEVVPGIASAIEEANENDDNGFLAEELNFGMPKEDAEMSEQVPGSNGEEMSFIQSLEPSQTTVEPANLENIENSVSSLEQDVLTEDLEGDRDGEEDSEAYHGMKSELGMWPGYLDKISKPAAIGIALACVIIPAVLAFLHLRQKQIQVGANADAPADQAEQIVETLSGSGSSQGHILVKGSQLQTPVADDTERFGGSGASQYSSSLSSGHGRRRNVKENDSLSLDPVSRRDSVTYSTSSYGSFTTYEKIPAKKKNKEDEAMTPVRRSSRLRNQVKSPEA